MKHRKQTQHIRRYRSGRLAYVNKGVRYRDPSGAYSRYEIAPVHRLKGRKTRLFELRDELEQVLGVPDISPERREEVQSRLDSINQQIKRITGRPPHQQIAPQKTVFDTKVALVERYRGTSGRRPFFVEGLNLPLQDDLPREARAETLRQRSREQMGLRRALEMAEEESIEEAVGLEEPGLFGLEELKPKRKGRPLKL